MGGKRNDGVLGGLRGHRRESERRGSGAEETQAQPARGSGIGLTGNGPIRV
jgi:hypothetical protein